MHQILEDKTEKIAEDMDTIIERMDTPEELVFQIIREMEEQLNAARETAKAAVESEERLTPELKQELKLMSDELRTIKQKAKELRISPKAV